MRRIAAVVLATAVVFVLAGCGPDPKDETEDLKTLSIGEIAEVDGAEYTVTNVKCSEGSDWDTPTEGKEYITVSISIENASVKELTYDSLDWVMVNSRGEEKSYAFTLIDEDSSLGSGVLKPGESRSGTITFEEAKGDSPLKLRLYQNDRPALEFNVK